MPMPSFFAVPQGDQSIFYLGQFFGTVGTVVNPTPGSTTLNIISYLFKGLNTTALIIGALLVTYTTIMGLLKTAQEGEFMGKQWSSLWVPVRMVIGIASLFPTTAGYSILQIVLMWIIVQGVGAADSLWTIVLQYVNAVGSPYASIAGAPTMASVAQSIESLYSVVTCNVAAQKTWGDVYTGSSTHSYYFCGDPNNSGNNFCNQGALSSILNETSAAAPVCQSQNGMINCDVGPAGACGSISFTDPAQCPSSGTDLGSLIACAASKAQMVALHQVINLILEPAANDLVTFDHEYMAFMSNVNPRPTVMPPIWLQNYCTSQNIPATAGTCCFLASVPDKKSNLIGWLMAQTSQCQKPQDSSNNTYFPPMDGSAGGQTDYGNANAGTIKAIIWPCGIAPILSGNPNNGACQKTTDSSADFLTGSVTHYETTITNAVTPIVNQYIQNAANLGKSGSLDNADKMQQQGWIMAGSYYFQIAGMNNNNLKNSTPKLNVNGTDPAQGNNPLAGYRNDYDAAQTVTSTILAQDASNQTNGPNISTAAPAISQTISGLSQTAGGITTAFMHAISGSGSNGVATNPLIAVQSLGETLMITAQTIYAVFLAGSIIVLVLTHLNFIGLGTGATEDPLGAAMSFLFTAMLGVLLSFMAWCFTTGAMLGIYTPLVPYIIFTFGALGWIIATIEAMVAAPFVALGILSPGGHDILGKSDAGLMILFNTFCRPSLMIIGMMSGMLLTPLAVTLINATYLGVMGSIDQTPGLLELIVFLTIYVTLILSVMNKCFALIYLIPDRVLSWLGHRAESSSGDSSEALSGAKTGGEKAAGTAAGQAVGGIKAVGGAADAHKKQQKEDKKERQASEQANIAGGGDAVQGPRRPDGTL